MLGWPQYQRYQYFLEALMIVTASLVRLYVCNFSVCMPFLFSSQMWEEMRRITHRDLRKASLQEMRRWLAATQAATGCKQGAVVYVPCYIRCKFVLWRIILQLCY